MRVAGWLAGCASPAVLLAASLPHLTFSACAAACALLAVQESMLDPDLHDTFGAHPSYDLPTVYIHHRRTASGGSASSEPSSAPTAGGWRQPMAAARRQVAPVPRMGGSLDLPRGASSQAQPAAPVPAAPDFLSAGPGGTAGGGLAGAAQLAAGQPPTVYQPHQSPAGPMEVEMSPIGHAMMLAPTSIPGQHSITVNDPQASGELLSTCSAGCMYN